ncbi:macro domain-containing protein CT2219-like [Adelges cooleyi]|uniref:macro domain-containing protein CT2219-like n=1 Tax=Adelges cooleyi TaxID=133065 RepID=UPI00217FAA55|nr:macro domain-containing protein CT2219-like [Adelges cooleyi]
MAKAVNAVVKLTELINWNEYYHTVLATQRVPVYRDNLVSVTPTFNEEINNKISLWQGDITKLEVDAVVTAANNGLLGGGGVDGAIHKAAGPELLEECKTLNGCETGDAKITQGYKLPAKHVIHTVGPKGEKPDLLKAAYENCLKLCVENNLKTVAFPCISTGVYGYPQEEAAIVAIKTIRSFLEENPHLIDMIVFTVFLDNDKLFYEKYLQFFFPPK